MDDVVTDDLSTLARRHLLLRLRTINRALARAVARQANAAARLARPDLAALCVTDEQVQGLLEELGAADAEMPPSADRDPEEEASEHDAAKPVIRPAAIRRADARALVVVDRAGRLVALRGDRNRSALRKDLRVHPGRSRSATSQRGADLHGPGPRHRAAALVARASSDDSGDCAEQDCCCRSASARTELRQELRIAPALLHWLLMAEGDPSSFVDPDELPWSSDAAPAGIDANLLCAPGRRDVQRRGFRGGSFGPRGVGHTACARAVAAGIGRPLRRLSAESIAALDDGMAAAAALGAHRVARRRSVDRTRQ